MDIGGSSCPFCAIIAGDDLDARVIFQDRQILAFFQTDPAVLGHTMLVPRQHVPDIWALGGDLAGVLGRATVQLASAIRRAMKPHGLNVIQSNGEAATQTVMHLHVHLVPRWRTDSIGRIWPPETSFTEDQKDYACEAIRSECRSLRF